MAAPTCGFTTPKRRARTREHHHLPIHDGHRGDYDRAAVISNDSDLRLPIDFVRNELGLRVGLLNPHPKVARGLQNVATFYKPIRKGVLQASQFSADLLDVNGRFSKPITW